MEYSHTGGASSVRPILRIGEYSLVALQHRRIRYIGLRVSVDTDTPAAITINSNLTLCVISDKTMSRSNCLKELRTDITVFDIKLY